jgi:hypothetical protein
VQLRVAPNWRALGCRLMVPVTGVNALSFHPSHKVVNSIDIYVTTDKPLTLT